MEIAEDDDRANAAQELRFLYALKIAVPASLDSKCEGAFSDRETELLRKINFED